MTSLTNPPPLICWLMEAAADLDNDWAADNQPTSQGGPRADGDPCGPKPWNAPHLAADMLVEADEILLRANRYISEFGTIEPETLARQIKGWRNRLVTERGGP